MIETLRVGLFSKKRINASETYADNYFLAIFVRKSNRKRIR